MKLAKKILILNGSPRKKGNTATLIKSFTEGAEQSGHTVTTFFLEGMSIHGCKGCYGGGKNPESPCVQKDDMDNIYPVYEQADVVVLASPMYFWSITGQLKSTFDRLFAVAEKNPNYQTPHKECVMLMAAEGNDEDNNEPVKQYYSSLLKHLNWKDKGLIIAGGVTGRGDIKGHTSLEEARTLGMSV